MPKPQTVSFDAVQTIPTALLTTLDVMRQELASMSSALQKVIEKQNETNPKSNLLSFRQIGLFLLAAGGLATTYFYFNQQKVSSSPDASIKQTNDAETQTEETTEEKTLPTTTQGGLFSTTPPRSPSPLNLTSHQDSPINKSAAATTTNGVQAEAGGSWWPWVRK